MISINNSLGSLVTRTSINLLKTGGALLLTNLANQALKEATNETVKILSKDIRQVRREFRENKAS